MIVLYDYVFIPTTGKRGIARDSVYPLGVDSIMPATTVEAMFGVVPLADWPSPVRGNRKLRGEMWKIATTLIPQMITPTMAALAAHTIRIPVETPDGEVYETLMFVSDEWENFDASNIYTTGSRYDKENNIEDWIGFPDTYHRFAALRATLANAVPKPDRPSGDLEPGPVNEGGGGNSPT